MPVDVSESALVAAGDALAAEYPGLAVHAVVADFEQYLGVPSDAATGHGARRRDGPRLVAFLGSTIGNMVPAERAVFLRRVRARLRPGDAFLLGTDLVKDPAVLVAAYDDAAGVTAAFNKNVLAVLNAELGADFDLDAFDHVAVWDAGARVDRDAAAGDVRAVGAGPRPRPDSRVRGRRGDAHRGIGQVPRGRGPRGAGRRRTRDALLVDGRRRPVRACRLSFPA